jgi:hypothetical protein
VGRRGPGAAALGIGLAAGAAALAVAAAGEPPLRAMRWVAPGADPQRAFGSAPGECLAVPADPALARQVEIGRAAFRTPVVLGGQAGRAGVSCETCHKGGRDNPDFRFPGVSGAPGTADVTSSLFSTHRGDGIDDPKPIPDLSGPKARLKVDQGLGAGKLEPFIHGLIVEEFDGPEPTPAVLAGLAAYVRALDPTHCPPGGDRRLTVASLMDDVRRALAAAEASLQAGDRATAVTLVAAARARLGLIDERYDGAPLKPLRERLRAADSDLADLQAALRAGRPNAAARLATWRRGQPRLQAALAAREPLSLFDPGRLAEAAKRRLPPGSS